MEQIEHTLEELELLVRRLPQPSLEEARAAASVVNQVLDANPAHVRALKLRAFLYHHTAAFEEAIHDLDRAIERAPHDADAHYWRALAKLGSYHEGKAPELFFGSRIFQAALDLSIAVRESHGAGPMVDALKWVIDHTTAYPLIHGRWRVLSELDVVPDLGPALGRLTQALTLSQAGHWRAAYESLLEVQATLESLGLIVLASSVNVHIADACIGLYEIQKALDHLDAFDPNLVRPLSPNFEQPPVPLLTTLVDGSTVRAEYPYEVVQVLGINYVVPITKVLRSAALLRLGDPAAAKAALQPLNPLVRQLERYPVSERVGLVLKLAPVLRDTGETALARAILEALPEDALENEDALRVGLARGLIRMKEGEFSQALKEFTSSARRAGRGQDPDRAKAARRWAATYVAMAHLALNQPQAALTVLRVHRHAPADEPLDSAVGYQHTMAQACLAAGDLDSAVEHLSAVLAETDRVRARFRSPEYRMNWQGRFEGTWAQAVSAYAARGKVETAFDLSERARARAFIDQVQTGHLPIPETARPLVDAVAILSARIRAVDRIEQAIAGQAAHAVPEPLVPEPLVAELRAHDPSADVVERLQEGFAIVSPTLLGDYRQAQQSRIDHLAEQIEDQRFRAFEDAAGKPATYAELRPLLRSSETGQAIVLLEYFVTDHATLLFVGRSDLEQPLLRIIDRPRAWLTERTLPAVQPWTTRSRDLKAATATATAPTIAFDASFVEFIAPVLDGLEPLAKPDDLLWIVPHGPLHHVPLHAVAFGGVPLIVRNPVCYSPSASIMPYARDRHRPGVSSALVVGDPRGDLSQARREALLVAQLLDVAPLLGADATKSRIQSRLSEARRDIVHFACHGRFDPADPLQSGLLVHPETSVSPDNGAAGVLTVRDLLDVSFETQLAVLSACQTGRSEVRPGDELIGLTRALLAAGAASLVVSLWEVDDFSTGLLMQAFYRNLIAVGGQPSPFARAQALRAAQRTLLESSAQTLAQSCSEQLRALRSTNPVAEHVTALEEILADLRGRDPESRPFERYDYWAPFVLIGYWG